MPKESFNNQSESMSTKKFYEELIKIDFSKEGPRLKIFDVDLDAESFIKLLSESEILTPIASSDGIISHVKESPEAGASDYSRSSRYFGLHTDGQYLTKVPEIVVLHCVDAGTSDIPTVFGDTKDIIDILRNTSQLEEAKEYEFLFRKKEGLEFVRPLLEKRYQNDELIMNIAVASPKCCLRPLPGSSKTQEDADKFYDLLGEIAEKNLKIIPHTWKKNSAIVFDNLRLIHGRGLLEHKNLGTHDIQRHLHRIWVSRNKSTNI
ncbi:hypothetical protein A2917_02765 [Candidatus Nomurabacteria bacterium RIFCSPLOWO2_01_FULL_42_17]|uniref:TauD/TfdA-like domain-containing protein n=1 Tax=Candidatus Nomurabacteria bacterium RIFCSPLOWO2_01_FULL_42_17 TaxID=1801780 RepID=A0A1F6XMV4_9BACT|nr:MAG: hypothetical protein A2917_02765 [Candidatus Nomurabacteria bacterium RIFCSPLOWO2_01_FULL_42_17]